MKFLLENRAKVILAILFLCAVAFTRGQFLTWSNITNVMIQIATDGIVAVGVTFIVLMGGIDLSVGSQIALTSVIVIMMQPIGGTMSGVLLALAAGLLIGTLNGLLITRIGISPFVTTLGMMTLVKGIALYLSDSKSHPGMDPAFARLADTRVLGIPFAAIIFLLLVLFCNWFLTRTSIGRSYYAVGGNPEAAWLAGLDTKNLTLSVYIIGGFCTAVAGILLTSRINTGSPIIADNTGTKVISAILLGGTSMAGGIGTVYGTLIGTLILGILTNMMNLMGISGYYQTIILGILLVLSVLADRTHYDHSKA